MENQKLQSRRDFMRTAGKIVLGATALGVASPLLSAYDSAKAEAAIGARVQGLLRAGRLRCRRL